jgi:electron transfer flavoprotein alpha subunit
VSGPVIALVPVRAGTLPLGGDEVVAEAGGRVLLVGQGTADAVEALAGVARRAVCCEQPTYAPAAWAAMLAPHLVDIDVIVLSDAPDGRDLAPRLAHLLDRPLLAGAVAVHADGATVAREGGLLMEELLVDGPFIATLHAGGRGVDLDPDLVTEVEPIDLAAPTGGSAVVDPAVVEVLPPDPATMDLTEAPAIVGGGAGLGSPDVMDLLGEVARRLGCSIGGTRVVTDWGWLPFERQIGTTGVIVHPDLYLAFGISGAVQHVSGLGDPAHIIAVNTDASCPMMSIADLAVVTDAPALVAELARRLPARSPEDAPDA